MMFGLIILVFIAYYIFGTPNAGESRNLDYQFYKKTTPLDIVNERYARGEIKRDEYLEKKQELMS